MQEKSAFYVMILILVLLYCGCQAANVPVGKPNDPPENVAAYLRTWKIGNNYWNADMIKGEYLSEIIIAFALINSNNTAYIPEASSGFAIWNEVARLKTKYPHLKVNVSVGGASEKGFPNMAADPARRAALITSVRAWMKNYNLDGVDIDWEYPVRLLGGGGSAADKQNYISLLRETRDMLDELGGETGKYYSLSTAVPADSTFISDNDVPAAAQIVDGFKLMAYDYYGSWSGKTGHNANLYNSSVQSGAQSTDKAVTAYLNAGVPPEKIILGVAFYGQRWNGVNPGSLPNYPGLNQSGTGAATTPGWTQIKGFLNNANYTRYWDSLAKAPFLYNAAGKIWISYTDEQQIQELCAYAREKGLGGYFVWEYGHDTGAELLKILADNS